MEEVETQNNTLTIEVTNDIPSETKDEEIEKHKKSIYRIIVSQYINEEYGSENYVVTYSRKDKSVLGWSIDIEKNSPQQPDVYFKNPISCGVGEFGHNAIGFLPNGDLIHVSSSDHKIYKYRLIDKPKNKVPWECSQIIDIKIPKDLINGQINLKYCPIYRTKLFLIVNYNKMLQFDLLTMNLERQYHEFPSNPYPVIMDKNQTLLAIESAWKTYMYSMETGMLIYKYDGVPIKFITIKNNSERLFVRRGHERKLVDPYYQVYDEINISSDFNDTSVMTNLNRKIFIDNGNVCITNGIDENKLQQLSDKTTYRNSIYTLSTFKIIQSMLNEIINQVDIKKVAPSYPEEIVLKDEVEIEDIGLCKIVLYNENNYDHMRIETNGYNLEVPICICGMLSFRLLNNQDWVIIDMKGISIYTFGNGFTYRYFWNNNEWNDIYENFKKDCGNHYDINFTNTHYKSLIERILRNEFDDSKHSIPITKFVEDHENEIIEDIINDNFVTPKFETKMLEKAIEENWNVIVYKIVVNNLSPRFGNEILKIAIKKRCDHIVQQIIELIQDYSESYMTIISLNLPEFCDHYPDYIIKYISRTSFILSPYCYNIKYSKNTSLYSYTDFIYIKESNMKNNYFKSISTIYECYYDIPVTEIRKLINAIDNEQTVFNYPPIISEKLRKLVVLTNEEEQNNKLEKQIEQTKDEFTKQNVELKQHIKEELTKQNVELKQQMERIMKYIGIEQDNENEEEQDNKEQDNKEEQDNELEQIEQTKEELPRQNVSLKQQMDKLSQQMENIMELLKKN
ncbi:4523_t:CDS:2 [Rhizophagus irregularis]|nr:4523_t:CDS:2 [Rhizophagus irregularis]